MLEFSNEDDSCIAKQEVGCSQVTAYLVRLSAAKPDIRPRNSRKFYTVVLRFCRGVLVCKSPINGPPYVLAMTTNKAKKKDIYFFLLFLGSFFLS